LTSGFLFVHFCEVAKIENHPQKDLAKIGYKDSFDLYLVYMLSNEAFFSFFPKIQKNGKTKDGQNYKFIFLFQGLSKRFTKKDK
jgi:hypothetical protein